MDRLLSLGKVLIGRGRLRAGLGHGIIIRPESRTGDPEEMGGCGYGNPDYKNDIDFSFATDFDFMNEN